MDKSSLSDRIIAWHDRVKGDEDPFFRLFGLWLCINAWMENESSKEQDRAMLKWLKCNLETSELGRSYLSLARREDGRQALERFASLTPITGRRTVCIASWDDHADVIDGIYVVRCNLFHGGKHPDVERDKSLVKEAGSILDIWLSELISSWSRPSALAKLVPRTSLN